MLSKYAQDQGFRNVRFFVDDGVCGTNFQCPGFQEMLSEIEAGKVGTVIVKDSYACSSCRKRTSDCTMHFIRSEVERDLILSALRSISEYARVNREAFGRLPKPLSP